MLRGRFRLSFFLTIIIIVAGGLSFALYYYHNQSVFKASEPTAAEARDEYVRNNINSPCETVEEAERCKEVLDLILKSEGDN